VEAELRATLTDALRHEIEDELRRKLVVALRPAMEPEIGTKLMVELELRQKSAGARHSGAAATAASIVRMHAGSRLSNRSRRENRLRQFGVEAAHGLRSRRCNRQAG
jgi:hypothetical protein